MYKYPKGTIVRLSKAVSHITIYDDDCRPPFQLDCGLVGIVVENYADMPQSPRVWLHAAEQAFFLDDSWLENCSLGGKLMNAISLTREQRGSIKDELRDVGSADELRELSYSIVKASNKAHEAVEHSDGYGSTTIVNVLSDVYAMVRDEIARRESEASS